MADITWHAVNLFVTFAVGIYSWIATGQRVHRQQLDTLETRVEALEQVATRHSERLTHLPTAEQVHALAVAIAEVKAMGTGTNARLDGFTTRLDRIEDFLQRAPR